MTGKDPTTNVPVATVQIIDVAARARALFGDDADLIAGRPLPDHEYRFVASTPAGGTVTFAVGATAEHVMQHLHEDQTGADR